MHFLLSCSFVSRASLGTMHPAHHMTTLIPWLKKKKKIDVTAKKTAKFLLLWLNEKYTRQAS